MWVLPDPVEVGDGSVLRVHYRRRVPGRPDGLTCEVVGHLTQDRPMWMMPHLGRRRAVQRRTPMVHVTAKTGDSHGNGASTDPPPDDDGGRRPRVPRRAGTRARQEEAQGEQAYASRLRRPHRRLRRPRADDAASELERLASLHQSGALSDDEFAAAKQKVLGV